MKPASVPPVRSVLGSKLRPPTVRADVLCRSGLIERLQTGSAGKLTLVTGAAGYGKTTLVRQWVQRDARELVWVNVDSGDNDPVMLFRCVLRALDQIEPIDDSEGVFSSPHPDIEGGAVPALGAALDAGRLPFVLVLDDVHLLTCHAAVELVDRLIDAVPSGSQIVLVGRSLSALHLGKRLIDPTTLEIEPSELPFSEEESKALLGRSLGDVAPETVDTIIEQTEGWPSGLQMAILALREHPDPDQSVVASISVERHVAAYFNDEFLRNLPEDLRRFLVRTSVLDRLSGPLCDAVLERTDSTVVLRDLVSSANPFVTEFDDDPQWFRYHNLFADLLLAELHVSENGSESELRRRAAAWLGDHGHDDAAMVQAIGTGDVVFASEILCRRLFEHLSSGHIASLKRWLAMFTPEQRRQNTLLALSAGWVALMTGEGNETDHWLGVLEKAHWDGPLPGHSVSFGIGRAALHMTAQRRGVKQVLDDAMVVQDAGPEGNPWWQVACHLGAVASHALGNVEDPVAHFEAAEFATRGTPTVHSVALAHLALAQFACGDPGTGHALVIDAVGELERSGLGDHPMIAAVHCAHAYSAALLRDLDTSRAAANRGLRILERTNDAIPRASIHLRLVLADAACVRGDHTEASALLATARQLLVLEPDAILLADMADRLRERIDRRLGDLHPGHDLTGAEMRVLEELSSHRSLEQIGEQLYVSRNTVKSHTVAIYRKLGVSRRAGAVERARELGLLRS